MKKLQTAINILKKNGGSQLLKSVGRYVHRHIYQSVTKYQYNHTDPVRDLMEEDWDNVILLDACRYDQFKRVNWIPGELDYRISRGSATPEFLTANFQGETAHDTVYVTANPQYRAHRIREEIGDTFFEVVDVSKSDWDESRGTVHPKDTAKRAIETYEKYPNKRLFVHFEQPHYPFIDEGADILDSSAGDDRLYEKAKAESIHREEPTVWDLARHGYYDKKTVRNAYNENLRVALPHVERLVDKFNEKTIITSDHGNHVGEKLPPFGRPVYGHPPYTYTDELRKVPWLIIEGETRKRVREDIPIGSTEMEANNVFQQLEDLGYVDDRV